MNALESKHTSSKMYLVAIHIPEVFDGYLPLSEELRKD